MKWVNIVATLLVWIGAINWGLWGLFNYNLVESVLGSLGADVVKWIYVLVGLSGVWVAYMGLTDKKGLFSGK